MGNNTSRVMCCLVTKREPVAVGVLDEGLGHSFYYVRPQLQFSSPSFSSSSITDNSFSAPSGEYPLWQQSDATLISGQSHEELLHPPANIQDKNVVPEKSFKSISGSSVSANTSNPRSLLSHDQFNAIPIIPSDRAAAFESTSSFTALPLQPIPKGVTFSWSASGPLSTSGPLEKGAVSGPLERGFMSGPLERGFVSGPLEKSHVSGSLDPVDRKLFSAPIRAQNSSYIEKRKKFLSRLANTLGQRFRKGLSRKFKSVLVKNSSRAVEPPRSLNPGDDRANDLSSQETWCGSEDLDANDRSNLQWAQALAGEDRVHIVLSEKHGWLFVGIYDGFNGPDATDFLMSNLYPAVYRELQGLLWDKTNYFESAATFAARNFPKIPKVDNHRRARNQKRVSAHELLNILDSWQKDVSFAYGKTKANEVGQGTDEKKGNDDARNGQISLPESATGTSIFDQTILPRQADNYIEDNSSNIKSKDTKRTVLPSNMKHDHTHDHNCPNRELEMSDAAKDPSDISRSLHGRQRNNENKLSPAINNPQSTTSVLHQPKATRGADPEERHKVNSIDHQAVLRALSRALKATEESYLDMADKVVADNPELALVGSCVLVMLMKDEDVYIMNVGDSRALLARQAGKDNFDFPSLLSREQLHVQLSNHKKDHEWIAARNSMLRMELERIIEEPTTEREGSKESFDLTEMAPPPISPTLDSVQLTLDHSTSIQQEVRKLVTEHPDDDAPIFNHRVKGRLKVTRAFGAGFLKKPEWNNALLEMFRIDFIGTAPYISCTPALRHHKLGPRDRFLVLSSDGLYQYLTNEEVISHVEWFMERFPEGDPAQYLIEELLFRAAKKAGMDFHELLEIPQGDRRKYHDDVSVMVISVEGRVWRSSR